MDALPPNHYLIIQYLFIYLYSVALVVRCLFSKCKSKIMNFYLLFSKVFMTLVILPLPRAVPGRVNSAVCDQTVTADQGIVSETVSLLVILSNFLNVRVMGEE